MRRVWRCRWEYVIGYGAGVSKWWSIGASAVRMLRMRHSSPVSSLWRRGGGDHDGAIAGLDGPSRFGCANRRRWALQANVGPVWFGSPVIEASALSRASLSQRRNALGL